MTTYAELRDNIVAWTADNSTRLENQIPAIIKRAEDRIFEIAPTLECYSEETIVSFPTQFRRDVNPPVREPTWSSLPEVTFRTDEVRDIKSVVRLQGASRSDPHYPLERRNEEVVRMLNVGVPANTYPTHYCIIKQVGETQRSTGRPAETTTILVGPVNAASLMDADGWSLHMHYYSPKRQRLSQNNPNNITWVSVNLQDHLLTASLLETAIFLKMDPSLQLAQWNEKAMLLAGKEIAGEKTDNVARGDE